MSFSNRMEIARHWQDCARVSRRDVFGSFDEKYVPVHLPDDASTMFTGYVGLDYKPGAGIVLLGKNPGGGGNGYTSRTAEDQVFYPLLMRLKTAEHSEILESFEDMNMAFMRIVRGWNLWRILNPTLVSAGVTIEEISYMNVIPYRTRQNAWPPVAARKRAWQRVVKPSLDLLAPKAIIALGKTGAGDVLNRYYAGDGLVYCVPRTNGDGYVSSEATAELDRTRSELRA